MGEVIPIIGKFRVASKAYATVAQAEAAARKLIKQGWHEKIYYVTPRVAKLSEVFW